MLQMLQMQLDKDKFLNFTRFIKIAREQRLSFRQIDKKRIYKQINIRNIHEIKLYAFRTQCLLRILNQRHASLFIYS